MKAPASAKDAFEAIGIPHVEVARIVVNDAEKTVQHLVQPNDRIEVFPYPDVVPAAGPVSFVLDVHLGKLARLLRMLGIDGAYQNNFSDQEMAAIAVEQNRTVLTRDIGLLKHKVIQHGYWLRSQHPEEQLIEVIRRYSLGNRIQPFSRSLTCNGGLQVIPKVAIHQNLLPLTKEYFHDYYQCRGCRKLYWKGSHYLKMQKLVAKIRLLAC